MSKQVFRIWFSDSNYDDNKLSYPSRNKIGFSFTESRILQ